MSATPLVDAMNTSLAQIRPAVDALLREAYRAGSNDGYRDALREMGSGSSDWREQVRRVVCEMKAGEIDRPSRRYVEAREQLEQICQRDHA